MAIRSQVHERLSKALDIPVFSMVRVTDSLAAIGATPKGRKGGGKGAAHFGAEHLKNVLLGASAHAPVDAADALKALNDAEIVTQFVVPELLPKELRAEPLPVGTKLGQYLTSQIERWGNPDERMKAAVGDFLNFTADEWWSLELVPSAHFAELRRVTQHRFQFSQRFISKDHSGVPPFAVRKYEIVLPVLAIAGELLADTLRQTETLIPDPPTGGKRKGDAPGNEKAATITSRRGPSKTQPADQPHSRAPRKVQAMAGGGVVQPCTASPHVSVLGSPVGPPSSRSNRYARRDLVEADAGRPRNFPAHRSASP